MRCRKTLTAVAYAAPPWVNECFTGFPANNATCNPGIEIYAVNAILQQVGFATTFIDLKNKSASIEQLSAGDVDLFGIAVSLQKAINLTNISNSQSITRERPALYILKPPVDESNRGRADALFAGFSPEVWVAIAVCFFGTKLVQSLSVHFVSPLQPDDDNYNIGDHRSIQRRKWHQVYFFPHEHERRQTELSTDSVKVTWAVWSLCLTVLVTIYQNSVAIAVTKINEPEPPFVNALGFAEKLRDQKCTFLIDRHSFNWFQFFPFRGSFGDPKLKNDLVPGTLSYKLMEAYEVNKPVYYKKLDDILDVVVNNPEKCMVFIESVHLNYKLQITHPLITQIADPKLDGTDFVIIYYKHLEHCVERRVRFAFDQIGASHMFADRIERNKAEVSLFVKTSVIIQ